MDRVSSADSLLPVLYVYNLCSDSNEHLCSMLRQFNFLNSIQNRLEKEEEARQVMYHLLFLKYISQILF